MFDELRRQNVRCLFYFFLLWLFLKFVVFALCFLSYLLCIVGSLFVWSVTPLPTFTAACLNEFVVEDSAWGDISGTFGVTRLPQTPYGVWNGGSCQDVLPSSGYKRRCLARTVDGDIDECYKGHGKCTNGVCGMPCLLLTRSCVVPSLPTDRAAPGCGITTLLTADSGTITHLDYKDGEVCCTLWGGSLWAGLTLLRVFVCAVLRLAHPSSSRQSQRDDHHCTILSP